MKIKFQDFNNAKDIIKNKFSTEWKELETVISDMPLFLKSSDQKGIEGRLNFDPVANNNELDKKLKGRKWNTHVPIPKEYKPMGKDIDFEKNGIIVEAQFSNYPFLLNNITRSELFFKSKLELVKGDHVEFLIIITKAHMFPSANSSLYYEQAVNQITFMTENKMFNIPLRLVCLYSDEGDKVKVIWTRYKNKRYSRNVLKQEEILCKISLDAITKKGKHKRKQIATITKCS